MSFIKYGFTLAAILASSLTMACGTKVVQTNEPVCSAEGGKHLSPAMSDDAVCQYFETALRREMDGLDGGLKIAIVLESRGEATARITDSRNGSAQRLPDLSISVSDRAMDKRDIDMLARAVAKAIDAGG